MNTRKLFEFIQNENIGETWFDEPLERYTTWRIGGPADIFCEPQDPKKCQLLLSAAQLYGVPVTFLGAGSNVLVADEGIRGVVIHTKGLKNISWKGRIVTAGSGVSLTNLSQAAYRRGLAGMEFASGIPGTLGGAVIMNAGAYGYFLDSLILEVKTLTKSGESKIYSKEELDFGYRTSALKNGNELVVQASMRLQEGIPEKIKELMDRYQKERREKQPLQLPNAGSVFRNPPGYSAGRLVEAAGAKGWRIGDAEVSTQHANFIVNQGKATASDVFNLIREVQRAVKEKFLVELETEIVILGF